MLCRIYQFDIKALVCFFFYCYLTSRSTMVISGRLTGHFKIPRGRTYNIWESNPGPWYGKLLFTELHRVSMSISFGRILISKKKKTEKQW